MSLFCCFHHLHAYGVHDGMLMRLVQRSPHPWLSGKWRALLMDMLIFVVGGLRLNGISITYPSVYIVLKYLFVCNSNFSKIKWHCFQLCLYFRSRLLWQTLKSQFHVSRNGLESFFIERWTHDKRNKYRCVQKGNWSCCLLRMLSLREKTFNYF